MGEHSNLGKGLRLLIYLGNIFGNNIKNLVLRSKVHIGHPVIAGVSGLESIAELKWPELAESPYVRLPEIAGTFYTGYSSLSELVHGINAVSHGSVSRLGVYAASAVLSGLLAYTLGSKVMNSYGGITSTPGGAVNDLGEVVTDIGKGIRAAAERFHKD